MPKKMRRRPRLALAAFFSIACKSRPGCAAFLPLIECQIELKHVDPWLAKETELAALNEFLYLTTDGLFRHATDSGHALDLAHCGFRAEWRQAATGSK